MNNGSENLKYICRTPVSKLRNSFRKIKEKRGQREEHSSTEYEKKKRFYMGVVLITVWIGDPKKLGLKLGGGSVSCYGDSNLHVLGLKKTSIAKNMLNVGDEILEIDGKSTLGMDIY